MKKLMGIAALAILPICHVARGQQNGGIRWSPSAPGCRVTPAGGMLWKLVETERFQLWVARSDSKPYTVVSLFVYNKGSETFRMDPADVSLIIGDKSVSPQTDRQIAKSIARSAARQELPIALSRFFDSLGPQPVPTRTSQETVTDGDAGRRTALDTSNRPVSGLVTLDTPQGAVYGRISNGQIRLDTPSGSVYGHVSNGNVTVDTPSGSLYGHLSNGNLTLNGPGGSLYGHVALDAPTDPSYGRTSTQTTVYHTEIDQEALRRQQEQRQEKERQYQQQVAQIRANSEARLRTIRSGMLDAGPVAPNDKKEGRIYFKKRVKGKDVLVRVWVDGRLIEFPFSKGE